MQTILESKNILEDLLEQNRDFYKDDVLVALDEAINSLEQSSRLKCLSKADLMGTLAAGELLHPYKIKDRLGTYSDYNKGWCEALRYIRDAFFREVE